ncbi:Mannose-binding lectin [Cordyceps militaris]|uniref:Mannose-binding lectin n=1 Tax=Cordyceps militaris TaxID=73501 RepID=A0A2H4SVR2_CORMI|nr:Mannose-binding lectin [Cordyceps militaris]
MSQRVVGPFGRNTNHPFSLFPNRDSTAKRFTVWSGQGSGDAANFIVIKGLEIEWFNGEKKKVYNRPQPGDTMSSVDFSPDETAQWSVRAGWRIVRFEVSTSKGRSWAFGGTSGELYANVANGKLVGFELSSGWEVDWTKITFLV